MASIFHFSRHGVVVALEDDDDLLQPVYQEPYNNPNMQRGALVLQEKSNATSNATSEDPMENIEDKEPQLQLIKKGRKKGSAKQNWISWDKIAREAIQNQEI